MTLNLKPLYDRVLTLDAARKQIGAEIVRLNDEDKFAEALALQPKLAAANKEYEDANGLYLTTAATSVGGEDGKKFVPANPDAGEPKETQNLRASDHYRNLWIEALRNGVTPKTVRTGQHSSERFAPLMNAISETGGSPAGSEGGFLNPVDFDGLIIERKRQFIDLADYVNVESVTAYSGWRSIEVSTAEEPFETLSELDVLGDEDETESPTFKKIEYTVLDKGGFLRLSNDQLADTPANIMAYIARWFGKKLVLTDNAMLLALVNAIAPTDVADSDTLLTAIKTVLNKTLDPNISAMATIFANQSGYDLLDKLEDENKRPLLQSDPTNATAYRLKGRPVIMLADRLMANLDGGDNAPIAIGSGQEFATLFRRQAFEMATTTIGGNSWRSNSTEARGIVRQVAKTVDEYSMALLSIAIPGASGS